MMAMMPIVCSAHMQVEMLYCFTLQNVKELEEEKEKISVEEGGEKANLRNLILAWAFFSRQCR